MIDPPDHHHAEAKRKAAHEGISLSEYIRRLVASDLDEAGVAADAVGLGAECGDGGDLHSVGAAEGGSCGGNHQQGRHVGGALAGCLLLEA